MLIKYNLLRNDKEIVKILRNSETIYIYIYIYIYTQFLSSSGCVDAPHGCWQSVESKS